MAQDIATTAPNTIVQGAAAVDEGAGPQGASEAAPVWQDGKLEIIKPEEEKTAVKALHPKPDWS
ncbi:hypothetical protein [Streptomyces sp. HGB0020]|uniref:hypothetical protein n=1 Tax=Streptomyces sp. HGB0020 TaxID=1078086 RepID=UPI00034E3663|nr:hypothetical protein [Streptomyces sp. HGB0020]EPD57764.1 hypothetical protein HMPREF1211_06102 [Streptomyces sp. HGB0020]